MLLPDLMWFKMEKEMVLPLYTIVLHDCICWKMILDGLIV